MKDKSGKVMGFEKIQTVSPQQVMDAPVREQFEKLLADEAALKKIKQEQQSINHQLESKSVSNKKFYNLQARLLRLKGEEKGLKYSLNKQRVDAYQIALVPETRADGRVVFRRAGDSGFFTTVWRWSGTQGHQGLPRRRGTGC